MKSEIQSLHIYSFEIIINKPMQFFGVVDDLYVHYLSLRWSLQTLAYYMINFSIGCTIYNTSIFIVLSCMHNYVGVYKCRFWSHQSVVFSLFVFFPNACFFLICFRNKITLSTDPADRRFWTIFSDESSNLKTWIYWYLHVLNCINIFIVFWRDSIFKSKFSSYCPLVSSNLMICSKFQLIWGSFLWNKVRYSCWRIILFWLT